MPLQDIVVYLEDLPEGQSRLEYAAALAARFHAHLSAVFVADALELHRFSGFAVGTGIAHMFAHHSEQVRAAAARYRTLYDAALTREELHGEWRISDRVWGEDLMIHARHSDLAVVGPADGPSRRKTALSLSEDMIFASGRPTLLVPAAWQSDRLADHIVIAWNASAEASRAVAGALPLLCRARQVSVVVVPQAGLPVPDGIDPGQAIVRHLARHGVIADLFLLEGSEAGHIVLDFCTEHDADLLVMGAYGHSKLSEAIFGGATRYVLRHAEIPILLSR